MVDRYRRATAAAPRRRRGGRAAGRALAARARVVVEPRADRRSCSSSRARRAAFARPSRPRRSRAASRRPTSTSRRRGGSASSPSALRRGRGLAQRHPLGARGRDARGRDPEPRTSRRARTRSRSPTSCSDSLDGPDASSSVSASDQRHPVAHGQHHALDALVGAHVLVEAVIASCSHPRRQHDPPTQSVLSATIRPPSASFGSTAS